MKAPRSSRADSDKGARSSNKGEAKKWVTQIFVIATTKEKRRKKWKKRLGCNFFDPLDVETEEEKRESMIAWNVVQSWVRNPKSKK